MSTIKERLQAELKKTSELQTIAIGTLVNKTTLERLSEQNNKIFDALIAHDQFTNQQLAVLRDQQIEEDGKIVGLQTEMRQRFNSIEQQLDQHDQRFTNIETVLAQILARLPEKP